MASNSGIGRDPYPSRQFAAGGIAGAACVAAGAAGLTVLLSGLGTRWGWWNFRSGLSIFRWGGYGCIATLLLCVVAVTMTRPGGGRKGFGLAALGLLVSLAASAMVLQVRVQAAQSAPIHDISTDTEHPPVFVAVLPLRKDALNPPEYGGPEIAAQQHATYPDITPLQLSVPPAQAFERALAAARDLGWEIVDAVPAQGRIEATDTTFWFGFKDDIVVRVTPSPPAGSRVDVRSVSRVGKGDVGKNASRIRIYLERLKQGT